MCIEGHWFIVWLYGDFKKFSPVARKSGSQCLVFVCFSAFHTYPFSLSGHKKSIGMGCFAGQEFGCVNPKSLGNMENKTHGDVRFSTFP